MPVLWSPNMSLGIAVVRSMMQSLKELSSQHSQQVDFQIEEWHHRHKKDSPSGTALWLQEALEKVVDKKIPAPLAVRGGGVFGVHKIITLMDEELITLEHTALNRNCFCSGGSCGGLMVDETKVWNLQYARCS